LKVYCNKSSRRLLVFFLLTVFFITSMGCTTLQKKFTRNKKRPPIKPQVFTQKDYKRAYSNKYYYTSHFVYWSSWHDELMTYLGNEKNRKRQKRAFDEILGHLDEMRRYLKEEKAAELQTSIDDIKLAQERYASSTNPKADTAIRLGLERAGRRIAGRFPYDKIKDHILPDEIDL
jgi:C-terminal processing protease CtpA/Prc